MKMNNLKKFLIVDDHGLIRESLSGIVRETFDAEEILQARNSSEALLLAEKHKDIDVVLLDLMIPGMGGLTLLPKLSSELKSAKFVIVTGKDIVSTEDINQSNSDYVCGIISKSVSFDIIRDSLKLYLTQGTRVTEQTDIFEYQEGTAVDRLFLLTKRQRQILKLISTGKSNKEISRDVFLSEGTVKNYVSSILQILKVSNRTEAVYLLKCLEKSKTAIDPINLFIS